MTDTPAHPGESRDPDYFEGTFDARFLGASMMVLASAQFNLLLAWAEVSGRPARWYVAVGGEAGTMFTPDEARMFGRRLKKHAKKIGYGHEDCAQWSKDLHEVAGECEERNAHGVTPEQIQKPN